MAEPELDTATAAPTLALDVAEVGQSLPVAAPRSQLIEPPVDEVATAVASLGAKMRYAEVIIRSSLVPKTLTHTGRGKNAVALPIEQAVANVVVVMEYGQLLNLHPMIAMAEINVLEGKPGCSGKLMRAKLNEAGHELIIHENSRQRAEVAIKLVGKPGSENATFSFDLDDALAAELINRVENGKAIARSDYGKVLPWEAYTDTMLFERAMAKAVRALCPEVTMGISYTIEELESMTRDVEAPAADPVWPHDYANTTRLVDVARAKGALVDLCDGDKEQARKVWTETFADLPVDQLVLGHLRDALGLPAPDGDKSVPPPLPNDPGEDVPGIEQAMHDAATSHQDTAGDVAPVGPPPGPAPSEDELKMWADVYRTLGNDALLGAEGIAEFREKCIALGYKSVPRSVPELNALFEKAAEMYRTRHGGPHQWDPAELADVRTIIKELREAEDPSEWAAFVAFTSKWLAAADAPDQWTSDQEERFVPWLMLGPGAKPVEGPDAAAA